MAFKSELAERRKSFLKIGMSGPPGAGKTMSALRLAYGLVGDWGAVGGIDTENGSMALYAGLVRDDFQIGQFHHGIIEAPFTPEKYVEAIEYYERMGIKACIIDSISHEWDGSGGCLEIKDEASKTNKNSYTVWSVVTPRHNAFVQAILQSKMHVICCVRTKSDVIMVEKQNAAGRTVQSPEKVGLKMLTRDGFDFEMGLTFDIDINNFATASKDRTDLFKHRGERVLTEADGVLIANWLETAPDMTMSEEEFKSELARISKSKKLDFVKILKYLNIAGFGEIPVAERETILLRIEQFQIDPETGDIIPEHLLTGSTVKA